MAQLVKNPPAMQETLVQFLVMKIMKLKDTYSLEGKL